MNIVNIKKAIAVMERAEARGSVKMTEWQNPIFTTIQTSEDEFHTCGNTACFAGHIAISPEFKKDGGKSGPEGSPVINELDDAYAISYWLGISIECADHLVFGACADSRASLIYGNTSWQDAKAEHVITALKQLLEHGEEECMKLWNGVAEVSEP